MLHELYTDMLSKKVTLLPSIDDDPELKPDRLNIDESLLPIIDELNPDTLRPSLDEETRL